MERYVIEYRTFTKVFVNPNVTIYKKYIVVDGNWHICPDDDDIVSMTRIRQDPSPNYIGEYETSKTKLTYETLKKSFLAEDCE